MLASIVEVEVHLACIRVGELRGFDIDDDQTAQAAIEEEKINAVPLVANPQSALATDKSEVSTKFQEERFQVKDQGFLELGFAVFILQTEKFQNEGIFDRFFRSSPIFRDNFPPPFVRRADLLRESAVLS